MARRFTIVLGVLLGPGLLTTAAFGQEPQRAYIGLQGLTSLKPPGAAIRMVMPGGPADKAGLKSGDVVTSAGDAKIKTYEELADAVRKQKIGDTLKVVVNRAGKEEEVSVKLTDRFLGRDPFPGRGPVLGVGMTSLSPERKKALGVDNGIVVFAVLPGSPAAKAGVKIDDVITKIDDQAIASEDDLRAAVRKAGAGKEITVQLLRGKEKMELKAQLDKAAAPGGAVAPPPMPGAMAPGDLIWEKPERLARNDFLTPKEIEREQMRLYLDYLRSDYRRRMKVSAEEAAELENELQRIEAGRPLNPYYGILNQPKK